MNRRLAIVSTHPIQYYAPWFRLLGMVDGIDLKVFYTWSQTKESVNDEKFGLNIKWDIPLLEGYLYQFVDNVSDRPGSHHYNGIICPYLIREIKEFNPTSVLVIGWKLKSHLKAIRYFHNKIPVYFRGDSTLLDKQSILKSAFRRLVLYYVYSKIYKAFYVGTASKEYFLRYGLNHDQLIFTPHAIENERFQDEDNNYQDIASKFRQSLEISQDDLVVLFAGKFETKKNPLFLVDAVQQVNRSRKRKIKLVMVGDGPLKTKLTAIANDCEHIKLLPFQNQTIMPAIYRIGDIYSLPSQGPGETWGLAINESFASSVPVIVSDKVGCSIDLVKHKKNGFLFSSNNLEQLKTILYSINKEECIKMGLNGNKLIQEWNFKNIVNGISEEILKNG